MTPEQQRIAIAEACGEDNDSIYRDLIPDYLNDLNAMHAVEEHAIHNLMDADEWMEYGMLLKQSHPHGLFLNGEIDYHDLATVCHATASQRAEAFLRTIGKWEEAK
jgi:hypothetical protein